MAAGLLIVVMYAVATTFWRGRVQIDLEEQRRKATAAAQLRVDELKAMNYGLLPDEDGDVSTLTVDGIDFTITLSVTPASPMAHTTTVVADVEWAMGVDPGAADDTRQIQVTTMIGRVVN